MRHGPFPQKDTDISLTLSCRQRHQHPAVQTGWVPELHPPPLIPTQGQAQTPPLLHDTWAGLAVTYAPDCCIHVPKLTCTVGCKAAPPVQLSKVQTPQVVQCDVCVRHLGNRTECCQQLKRASQLGMYCADELSRQPLGVGRTSAPAGCTSTTPPYM